MSDRLIKISKEYKAGLGGVWLGVEVSIPPEKDIIESFKEQDELLDKAYSAINPHINWQITSENSYNGAIDPKKEDLKEKIQDAQSKEELMKFQNDAIKYNLVPEYLTKQKSLSTTN